MNDDGRGGGLGTGPEPEAAAVPRFDRPARLLTTVEAVEDLARRLRDSPRFGIDLEADSFHHYRQRICLVQIHLDGEDYLIDPLAGARLEPLVPILADGSCEKIFHGGDNDLVILHDVLGVSVENVFDTMIAAQVCGHRRPGLSVLLHDFFNLRLDKSLQRHDWSKRPLLPEHIHYARADAHFLCPLRDRLHDDLQKRGRLAQVLEECRLLPRHRVRPNEEREGWRRISGAGRLSTSAQGALEALFQLRDKLAREADRPHFRILPNETLLELVLNPPRQASDLGRYRRLPRPIRRRYGDLIIETLQKGAEAGPSRGSAPTSSRPRDHGAIERRFERLRLWRKQEAERLDVEFSVVASNAQLKALAARNPDTIESLRAIEDIRDWQIDAFGRVWLDILRTDQSPDQSPS